MITPEMRAAGVDETTPLITKAEAIAREEFDGYEDLVEPTMDGKYTTVRTKLWLSTAEVKKFMGDNDPAKYFRDGKVPVYFPKANGTLLADDRMEREVQKEVFRQFPEVLMFKHDLTNIYTMLIPKVLTEHEFVNGDFVSRLVRYDTRSVVFNGGVGRPTGFEADYFKKQSAKILTHLTAKAEQRKVY